MGGLQLVARRRRPSGEPPPLPRHVRRSGVGWLVAAFILVTVSVTVFSAGWRGPAVAITVADDAVVRWLSAVSVPGYARLTRCLAAAAALPLLTVLLWTLVVALLVLRRLRHLVVFLVAWNIAALLFEVIVPAAQRPRPFDVPIRGSWGGWALPSLQVAALSATIVAALYTLVPEGRWRNYGKWAGVVLVGLVALARISLGVETPVDVAVGAAIGVAIPLVAFRMFTPNEAFPITYKRGRSAHLDVGGARGAAIQRALEEQLGLVVGEITPFGLAGSAGSTPLRIRVRGNPDTSLFGKLYAENHLRSDRWYKLGRELLYGRLEDEKPFTTVRRLVQQEDYALRLFRDHSLPTPAPGGVAELTPEREYLLVTEFFEGAVELGEVQVDDDVIDAGLRIVRQLWDAGLAHRDIKPSNLLVRDGRMLLIDVAFAELRPSPWRQAVDLANMMLCLALQSSTERVYERAQQYFSLADIGEAFAAARGLALPSQLRHALRAQGRDLHGEFIRLLPEPPAPVAIQRWNLRRVGLWICVLLAALLIVQSRSLFTFRQQDITSLGVSALSCRQLAPMWLTAQSVPSSSLLPCVLTLPAGWRLDHVAARSGQSTYTFDNDRAGSGALVARLVASCDVRGATEIDSADSRVRRFQRPPSGTTFEAVYHDVFPGGCVTYRLTSTSNSPDVTGQVAGEAPLVLGYESRRSLQAALAERSDGRLRLDPRVTR
jgi:tRNA A-37 threonylcarbamoyl transferase component Bud32/membrane-associated phospholipid phosphatase